MEVNMQINPLNKYKSNIKDDIPQFKIEQYLRAKTCLSIIERKFQEGKAFGIELFAAVKSFSAFVNPPDEQIMQLVREFLSDRVIFFPKKLRNKFYLREKNKFL
jgi:hypothetical protein